MKKTAFAIFLCVVFLSAPLPAIILTKLHMMAVSIPGIKAGTDIKIYVEGTNLRVVKDKTELLLIPASAITEVSYGQDVHRRVGRQLV